MVVVGEGHRAQPHHLYLFSVLAYQMDWQNRVQLDML